MKILVFGSLNIDNVYSVDHAVEIGETISVTERNVFCGGKGLNQAIAIAKAGVPVYLAGQVGRADGQPLIKACKDAEIRTDYLHVTDDEPTGHTIIQVNKEGNNCILVYGGANKNISKEYITSVLDHFEEEDLIVLQNEINQIDTIVQEAYRRGMKVVLNPSPYDSNLKSVDLSQVYMLLINEIEGRQITGESEPRTILEKLDELCPETKVVLTLGEKGSIYHDKDQDIKTGIYEVKPVDTTAAGDTFTGYLIAGIYHEIPVKEALRIAAKASSITVSRKGAVASIPLFSELGGFSDGNYREAD